MKQKNKRKKTLDDICNALGIRGRTDDRRRYIASALDAFGEEQIRAWIAEAKGNYIKWERLARKKQRRAEKKWINRPKKRKKKSRLASRISRREEVKRNAREGELEEFRYRENVTPTTISRDPHAGLVEVRQQLEDELSKGSRASQFILAGLRERISELLAETNTPKI